MPKKTWAKYSYLTAKLLLGISYVFGVLPIVFDMENLRIKIVNSRKQQLRCWIVLMLQISVTVVICACFIIGVFAHGFDMKNVLHLVNAFICACFLFSGFLVLHAAWKLKELVAIIGGSVAYYESFQSKILA